jgi:hypothetical protein
MVLVKGAANTVPRPLLSSFGEIIFCISWPTVGSRLAQLMQAITDDPLMLSHLLSRELPDELNVLAQAHKMAVFPKK